MGMVKIVRILLIVSCIAGLVYSQFSYTRETQKAKIGALELTVKDTKTVNIPIWAGVAALAASWSLLVFPGKKA
jgi:hypothetical protein